MVAAPRRRSPAKEKPIPATAAGARKVVEGEGVVIAVVIGEVVADAGAGVVEEVVANVGAGIVEVEGEAERE